MRKANGGFIYRRYIRTRGGKVLDAHAYGHKAWPIPVRGKSRNG